MPNIEYAGGYTLDLANESRRGVVARAPKWWQDLARETYQRNQLAQAKPNRNPKDDARLREAREMVGRLRGLQPTATTRARTAGSGIVWAAGFCAPGLSVPVFSERDAEQLPEQLTPDCWGRILRDITAGKRAVDLTLGHYGPVLASTPLDLTFRKHGLFGMGLRFTARIKASVLPAKAADALGSGGVGVSIGFGKPRGWIAERSGIGRVRIINECVLHHVALILPGSGQKAAYAGARCYGVAGERHGCPQATIDKAEVFAYRELARQAGARP